MSSLQEAPLSPQSRAAIYCRVSTIEQSERGYSLDAQAHDCHKLAAELGTTVIAEYQDTDTGSAWDLPGLNALLDAATRREFEMVICYDPDRLARRMAKQMVIEDTLTRAGVALRYVTLRLEDNAEDRLLKNVRASVAEYEREKIAMRTARGRRAKAERGLIVGNGRPPYGYRYTRNAEGKVNGLEPDPQTAPIVQRIFAAVAHLPVQEVCNSLNDEGIPTYFGAARWVVSTLLSMLENPAYLGTAAYGRRDTNKRPRDPSNWLTIAVPPLVDRSIWDAAHDALTRRKVARRPRNHEADDAYVLRGLLTCAHCGGMLACIPNNGFRYYTCLRNQPSYAREAGQQVCPLPAVFAPDLEAYVWERVQSALLNPEHLTQGVAAARAQNEEATRKRNDRLSTLDREVNRLRTRLGRITGERMDADPGSETDRALRAVAAETEDTIRKLLTERAELEAEPAPGLSADDALALEQFAAEVSAGLDGATTSDHRQVYGLLRVNGKVSKNPDGIRLGRRHRFTIELRAVIELPDMTREYKKTRVRYFSPEMDEWNEQHLGVAAR